MAGEAKSTRKYGRLAVPCDGLYLGSKPVEHLPLFDDTVDAHRRVKCRRYSNCVTFAANQNWTGFSCARCKIEESLSVEEQYDDLPGLADVLTAINLTGRR